MKSGNHAIGCGIALMLVALTSGQISGRQQLTISMIDALTMYELGENAQVTRALDQAKGGDADALLALLKRDVPAWIEEDGPADVPRRRLIAATFMLEVGNAGIDHQWLLTSAVTEWACDLLRKAGKPTEIERRWHLSALALLESNFLLRSETRPNERGPAIRSHLNHIKQRFPDEPRLLLAEALVDEYDYWTSRLNALSQATDASATANESSASGPLPKYEKAAALEPNRREAHLRMGFLEFKRGNLDRALSLLASAAGEDDDVTRTYLAHLFAGWTQEKAGRMELAITSFRHALSSLNGLSAALGLGVRLYAIDARDEADAIVARALAEGAPDPFKLYGYGDFRRWPHLISGLRQEVLKR